MQLEKSVVIFLVQVVQHDGVERMLVFSVMALIQDNQGKQVDTSHITILQRIKENLSCQDKDVIPMMEMKGGIWLDVLNWDNDIDENFPFSFIYHVYIYFFSTECAIVTLEP